MITLYDFALSGNCHKIRMFLSLLQLPYVSRTINLVEGEQRKPEYLAINPFGQVPVLTDGDFTLRDSQAILVYLACKHGGARWWPDDA
ncbi:glutathione S-transferase [Gammaproteobacteria bacterium]